jgi:signal transduction histidine kinase/ligand-binding sensor domain-containing protein
MWAQDYRREDRVPTKRLLLLFLTSVCSSPRRVRIWVMLPAIACALSLPVSGLDPNKSIQQFTHTSWSAKDGLPGPVEAIVQTPDGYLWLGTQAGLYQFDGEHIISWEAAPGGEKLPRSSILSLFGARDGSLWIGFASSAISRLRHGTLHTYTPADGLHTGGVLSIAEDQSGCIWAGGASGFSRFKAEKWNRVGAELGYPAPGARQLLVDRRGTLWVGTDGLNFGLGKDSIRVNTILKLPRNGKQFEATGQPVGYVAQLAEAPDGEIWMAEGSGPGPTVRPVYGRSGPTIERAVQTTPWCILFDDPSSLWIGMFHGGGIVRATHFKHLEAAGFERFESKDGLSSDGVRAAFKDREGNVWFGTNRGVDRFRENKATPFSTKEGIAPNPQVALASTPDGSVWIINYARDLVQHFHGGRIVSQTLPPYSRSDSARLLSLYSANNRVWLGGSFKLAGGIGGKFAYIPVPGVVDRSAVEAITSDFSGNLWIVVWETDKSRVMRLRHGMWTDFRDSPELPKNRCRVLFGDAAGRVWLGFESGEIAVYQNGRFHLFSRADGPPLGRILSITADRAGHIWIGGESGLSRFDGEHFMTLTKEEGLPGASVSCVLEDDDGFLWIAGALGIIRVSLQEVDRALKQSSYRMQRLFLDTTDGLPGLPSQEEPFPTATKAADGRLWFATADGVAVIDPRRLPMNAVPPPVVIQSVTADNRSFAISPELHFPAKARNLEIGFAALSLSVPERVLFRYKLEGYDTDWHGPAGARSATYTNLPPQHYRFRVVGCNNDGLWNEGGATLAFDIAPMFYQTNWFLLLCGIIVSLLIWVVYRWRLRMVTGRLDLQYAERLSERERIARELHDTLLQGIQGLMLRFQAVAKEIPENEPTRQMLEGALDRADEVMAEGRDRVRGLRTSPHGSEDLSQAFSIVAREFVDSSHTVFRVVVEGAVRPLHPLVRDEAYRIGSEALINAFLHGNCRHIELEITYSPKELRIRVQDDGQGIDPEVLVSGGKESHWGLRGMRERASKIHGHLEIRSKVGAGTEVDLIVTGRVAYEGAIGRSDRRALASSMGGHQQ